MLTRHLRTLFFTCLLAVGVAGCPAGEGVGEGEGEGEGEAGEGEGEGEGVLDDGADCTLGPTCRSGRCEAPFADAPVAPVDRLRCVPVNEGEPCVDDTGCGDGLRCGPLLNDSPFQCNVADCDACDGDDVCLDRGLCGSSCEPPGAVGDTCDQFEDSLTCEYHRTCAAGLECITERGLNTRAGVCGLPGAAGAVCSPTAADTATDGCQNDLVCAGVTETCVPPCVEGVCPDGLACSGATPVNGDLFACPGCVAPGALGETCETDGSLERTLCAANTRDCAAGLICRAGACDNP